MHLNKRAFLKTGLLFGTAAVLPPAISAAAGTPLSGRIANSINAMRRKGLLAPDETTAWLVTDINSGRTLAAINADRPMQCASMVKPLVIQAYMYCHFLKNANRYPINDRIMEEMHGMIVHSNNTFTNYLFKRLGGPAGVQWILRKQAPRIFRNIHIVENIPNGGRTYRNRASAGDYTRFLYALWHNQLPGASILKNLMSIKNHDRISVNTQHIPSSITVYDKTGSTARLCGDFGILDYRNRRGQPRPYSFTGIIEKSAPAANYTRWITDRSNVMRSISDDVYLYIDQQSNA